MLLRDLPRILLLSEQRAELLQDIDRVGQCEFVVTVNGKRADANLLEVVKPVLRQALELRVAQLDMRIADYGVEIR